MMAHLTSDQLIDLVEGTQPESSAPHLRACSACRRQLAELRTTMARVAEIEVPEPSPLFWDHLSARVRSAVDAGGEARPSTWPGRRGAAGAKASPWLRLRPVWVTGLVVFVATLTLVTIRMNRLSLVPTPASGVAALTDAPDEVAPIADDPSLSLVADLAADLDWESAREAGLIPRVGRDDAAVNQLTDGERRELRQLLQGELAPLRRGAS
jgi:hypothetical protein